MNKKRIAVVWGIAAWILVSFALASYQGPYNPSEHRGEDTTTILTRIAEHEKWSFKWSRDSVQFLIFASLGLVIGIPLVLTVRKGQ